MKNRTWYTAKTTRALSLLALTITAGCSLLGRGQPAQQHFVLGGAAPREAPGRDGLAGLKIGVRRLDLASYLESPFILVRRGPNRLGYSEFHRWGENLGGAINRTVAGYLGERGSFAGIDVAPWPAGERHDYIVQLHVLRFEGEAPDELVTVDGEAVFEANWEIIRQLDGLVVARGVTNYREAGWKLGDYAGLVTLLDAGLYVLTDQLVGQLEGLSKVAAVTGRP